MAIHKDHSPVSHTCPMIDEVISAINSVDWEETYWTNKGLIEVMEKIRSHNGALRDWGNEYCNKESDLVDELDELNRTIERLNDEVASLKQEIKDLENHLQEATN